MDYYSHVNTSTTYFDEAEHATKKGIAFKTLFLLALTIISAAIVAIALPSIIESDSAFGVLLVVLVFSSIIALVCGIAGRFESRASKYCGVIYALCEGMSLGCITRLIEFVSPGAGFICITATVLIFAIMLLLYITGIVKASNKLFGILIGVLIGAVVLSIITLVLSFSMSLEREVTMLYAGIEVLLLLYGVISLTFNFAEADAVVDNGCSKNAEWVVSLGITVSLIYIYIRMLRLVLYLASRRK